ncbi:energy transducer TonB [Patescibacteria group bacterium]|nr:energy transducer TonB [Patescibacteria group bacterium]
MAISVGLHGTAIASFVVTKALTRKPAGSKRIVILDPTKLGAPPSITDRTVPPSIKVAAPKIAPPAAAKPVAVPDEEDKEEVTIQSQEELQVANTPTEDATPIGVGDVVLVIPEEPEIPSSDIFTPYEVASAPIVNPRPDYPEMAKTAGVKGKVVIKVYVDKKGDVRQWEIIAAKPSNLGFEEEVIKVIRKWKFTPAIQQNNPVGVWIAIPFNFEFKK